MKKIAIILGIILIINFTVIPTNTVALESEDRIYLSKSGDMWNDYVNMMNIVFPGEKISGLYYHKIYAKYNAEIGGFVVIDKKASHISYTKNVGETSFGLCFSYNPEYKEGREFGKENYKVWSKIREGDILYPHGIDFTAKTINTHGNLSDGTLKTDAYFSVVYSERQKEPTAYSGKTIVALGDSVTCNGGWTETLGDKIGCDVINSGVSADRATEALLRFEKDVADYSPDIVLVMLGINDCVQYHYSDKTVLSFKNQLIEIYNKCRNIGAKVVYITPNNIKTESLNFDRYKEYGGLTECFPKFIQTIKDVSAETNSYCIDVYSSFENTSELLCDSVHPNFRGYDIIISKISEFLISYADRICGKSLEGFILTGEKDVEINNENIILERCSVKELNNLFCNEIKVYLSEKELTEKEYVTENCVIYWIDSFGNLRDGYKVIIK